MTSSKLVLSEVGPYAESFDEPLRRLLALPRLEAVLDESLRAAAGRDWLTGARRLVLSGSGDSLFGARSALPALRRWTGLPAECMSSIEFSRYEAPLLEAGDVLLAISNSGSSSRTRECVALARDRGIPTLGITGNADGPLARSADLVLHRPVEAEVVDIQGHGRAVLHAGEYLATLTALYALALALGRARGRLDDERVRAGRAGVRAALETVPDVARECEGAARELAESTHAAGLDTLWVLGAGPSRGTAEYSAAKFHEQVPLNGVAQDLEEWAHLQYFLTLSWERRSMVLVLAPPGNASDRAREIVEGIEGAGGQAVLVTAAGAKTKPRGGCFELPGEVPELLSPLLYHLPAQLIALHRARLAGRSPTPIRRIDDFRLIRGGAVRESAEELS